MRLFHNWAERNKVGGLNQSEFLKYLRSFLVALVACLVALFFTCSLYYSYNCFITKATE